MSSAIFSPLASANSPRKASEAAGVGHRQRLPQAHGRHDRVARAARADKPPGHAVHPGSGLLHRLAGLHGPCLHDAPDHDRHNRSAANHVNLAY
jgi:hypothetical protein